MRAMRSVVCAAAVCVAGCGGSDVAPAPAPGAAPGSAPGAAPAPAAAPGPTPTGVPESPDGHPDDYITVDHILIGIKSPQLQSATRSAAEAKKFAYELLAKIQAGEDWNRLKQEFSNDRGPGRPVGGPYTMANYGLPKPPGGMQRRGMVPAFGDVGWSLGIGEVGIADHHAKASPFGYHLIKRLPCDQKRPLMAGAQHILIQWRGLRGAPPNVTRSEADAKALAEKVQGLVAAEGADWAALVLEHSDDRRSAPREGWIGIAVAGSVGALLKPVAEALFEIEEGQVTPVVRTDVGFHIARRASSLLEVRASHVLVNWKGAAKAVGTTRSKEEARAEAEKILAQARSGADFATLARNHSDGPSGNDGGDVSWLSRGGGFAYPFERAAFELEVGAISDLVETEFGWHIIKRTR